MRILKLIWNGMVRSTHPIGIQVEDEPGPFFFSNYINRVDSFSEKKLQYLLIFKCLNLSILAFLNLLLMTITILLTNAILFHLHQAVAVFGKKKGIKSNCQLKQLIYSLENFLGKKKKVFLYWNKRLSMLIAWWMIYVIGTLFHGALLAIHFLFIMPHASLKKYFQYILNTQIIQALYASWTCKLIFKKLSRYSVY